MKKLVTLFTICLMVQAFVLPFGTNIAQTDTFHLSVMPGNNMVRLSWDDVQDSQGYLIYKKTGEDGEYYLLNSSTVVGNNYIDTDTPNESIQCYGVSALNLQGDEFAKSNQECVTPKDQFPTFAKACNLTLVFQVDNPLYYVNGTQKTMKSPVLVRENRTFLLFRHVIEEIGGKIGWDATEKRVDITYKSKNIKLWIGKSKAQVDGVEVDIDPTNPRIAPFIYKGFTYVPLRFPVTSLGEGTVLWHGDTKQITLMFPDRCTEIFEGMLEKWSDETNIGILTLWNGDKKKIFLSPSGSYVPMIGDCLRVEGRNDSTDDPTLLMVSKVELIDCPATSLATIEGKILSVDKDKPSFEMESKKGKVLVVAGVNLDSLNNLIRRLVAGECVRATGRFTSEANFTAQFVEHVKCSESQEEYSCNGKWISGYVVKSDCTNNSVTLKPLSGDTFTAQIPQGTSCLQIRRGQCFRACTTDGTNLNLLFTFDCDSNVCTGEGLKGKIIDVNKETGILKVSQGDKYVEVSVEGLDISVLENQTCVEVCAVKVDGKYVALWVRPLSDEECQECQLLFKAKVLRVDCKSKRVVLENVGRGELLEGTFTSESFCQMESGQCYEICATRENGQIHLESFKQIDCPSVCQGETVTGLVATIDCDGQFVKLLTDDGEKTYRISRDVCANLAIKTCIRACIEKDSAGNITLVSFVAVDGSNCPAEQPKDCKGDLFTAKVVSTDCKNGKIKVYVIKSPYGSGMTMELPVSDNLKNVCAKLVPGRCYKVCADTSNMFSPKLLWMEEIPCPEPSLECNKTIKGKIADMDCATDGNLVLLSDGVKIEISIKTVDPCKDFKVGDCVEACVYDVAGAVPTLVKLTALDPGECEAKPECKTVVAKVVATDCQNNIVSLKTSEASFRAKAKEVDICKQIQTGMCIKACIDFTTEPYTLVSFEKTDDGECPGECDEMIKVNVTSVWCSNKYIEGTEILTVEARTPRKLKITFDNDDFCKMTRLHCYLVCVSKDENGNMKGNWFKEISCQSSSDCDGRIVETTIASLDCDNGKVKFAVDGEIITATIDTERCSTLKPGLCVRVCLSQDANGVFSARILDILDSEKCQSCSCSGKLVNATVTEVDNQSGVAVIKDTDGNQIKILLSDKSVSLNLYDCIRACLVYDSKNKVWLANSISFLPQEECSSCTENIHKGIIKSLDCDVGFLSIKIGDSEFKVKYETTLCYRLRVGEYVAFCGQWDATNRMFVAQWIRQIDRKSCDSCTGRKVFGTISKYQPDQLTEILTESGTIKFHTENKAFIEMMADGGCFEVCLQWNQANKWFELENINYAPESVCENMKYCKGQKFEGVITGQACQKNTIKIAIGKNIWTVDTSKTDFKCSNDMIGKCVEICGTYVASTAMPTTIVADYIRVKQDQDCNESETETIRGILRKLDSAKGTAQLETGRTLIKLVFNWSQKLKEGTCYKCVGYYKPDGTFVVLGFTELDHDVCNWSCDGDTVTGQLLDFTNEGSARFVAGGQIQKVKLSDVALEYLQKNAPSHFPLCVKVCIKAQTATTALPSIISDIEILSMSECNNVCSGQTLGGTIDSLDCKNGTMTIIDTHSDKQVISINSGLCQRLKVGMCVKICLSTSGKLSDGSYEAAWVEEDASSCGQTCQKVTASVYEVTCSSTSVLIKCMTKDQRYSLTLSPSDCKTYQNAKCINFCLELVNGKLTGKIVGKVEVLPEGSCSDIPDPCDGKITWNATVIRLDCTNGKAYLNLGGKTKEAYISQSLCKELVIGKCYRFCVKYSNSAYSIDFASSSSSCELECFEGKAIKFDSASRRVVCENDSKVQRMIVLPMDFSNRLWSGMCVKACGTFENNMLVAQWAEETKCSTEEPIEFSGTITGTNCRTRVITVKTDDGKSYNVKLPDSFNCSSVKQGSCVSVKGTIDENKLVTATSVTIVECQQTWNAYIFDVNCSSEKPYMIVRCGEKFYTAYLPKNYSCRTLKPNTCIILKGYLRESNSAVAVIYSIEVTQITVVECRMSGPYKGTIVGKDCSNRYIMVEYNNTKLKLFYPSSFNCNDVKTGTCIIFYGTVNSSYIECYKIEITECQRQVQISGKVERVDCKNSIIYVRTSYSSLYTVDLNKTYNCSNINVGVCVSITGYTSSQTSKNIKATSTTIQKCQNILYLKIVSKSCSGSDPTLVCEDTAKKKYSVVLTGMNTSCERYTVGSCINVVYKQLTASRTGGYIVTPQTIEIVSCN